MSVRTDDFIAYETQRPPAAGLYEWRVPSTAVPGLIIRCVAEYRIRGAGYTDVLSPAFDHWDGYRVIVPHGIGWRQTMHENPIQVLEVEGVFVAPCPFCEQAPKWSAHAASMYGGFMICPEPHRLNYWQLSCCDWGRTPPFRDPRELCRVRDAAFASLRK